jgi:hypothetical protein
MVKWITIEFYRVRMPAGTTATFGSIMDEHHVVYRAMTPHARLFHELHRRLQRTGLQRDHRCMLALDRALDRIGTIAMFTASAAGRKPWQMDDLACERPEWWTGDGI